MTFLVRNSTKMLLKLEDGVHIMKLKRLCGMEYSSLRDNLMKLAYEGIIRLEDSGRLKKVYLTDKGRKIQEELMGIYEVIKWKD